MKWYERLVNSPGLRILGAITMAFLWTAFLLHQYSLGLDLALGIISLLMVFNLRDYMKDFNHGVSTKHDFAGWLILNLAATAVVASVVNVLFLLHQL
ncbi:hypothetical protein AH06_90 [Erwinia phage AH06]|nr:hypothetical protein AH06_90 [Erwinia phage AH06]